MLLGSILFYRYYPLFFRAIIDGHLGCFLPPVITAILLWNFRTSVLVHMSNSCSRGQSPEWNGCFVGLHIINFTNQCQTVFQNGYILSEGKFLLLYVLGNAGLVRPFHFSQFGAWDKVYHYVFNLHFLIIVIKNISICLLAVLFLAFKMSAHVVYSFWIIFTDS